MLSSLFLASSIAESSSRQPLLAFYRRGGVKLEGLVSGPHGCVSNRWCHVSMAVVACSREETPLGGLSAVYKVYPMD